MGFRGFCNLTTTNYETRSSVYIKKNYVRVRARLRNINVILVWDLLFKINCAYLLRIYAEKKEKSSSS